MITTYKDIKIHYKTIGTGTPMVLLHGFLENSTMWDAFIPELSKKHQVITIDLLGHGETACLGYIHEMETMAKVVAHVLAKENLSPAILVGHSMGGYVALALIEKFSECVASLMLLNSTASADSPERRLNRDRGIQVVKRNPTAYTSMAIANLFAAENRKKYTAEIHTIKNEAAKTPLQGIIAAQEGMKIRKDRIAILHNFKGKKLLVAGIQDPIINHQHLAEEAHKTSTEFIALDGGHMLPVENFESILSLLLNYSYPSKMQIH